MTNNEQLRAYSNEANRLSLAMIQAIDELNLKTKSIHEVSVQLDMLARQLGFVSDSIKQTAYELRLKEYEVVQ